MYSDEFIIYVNINILFVYYLYNMRYVAINSNSLNWESVEGCQGLGCTGVAVLTSNDAKVFYTHCSFLMLDAETLTSTAFVCYSCV